MPNTRVYPSVSTFLEISIPGIRGSSAYLVLVLPLAVAVGFAVGGVLVGLPLLLVFVGISLGDVFLPADEGPTSMDRTGESVAFHRRAVLFVWLAAQLALQVWGLVLATRAALDGAWGMFALTALATGALAGPGGATVAHELMHMKAKRARAAAHVLMTAMAYPHFSVLHLHSHHRDVATPLDPAFAPRGRSLWGHLPRALVRSIAVAWRISARRAPKQAWWSDVRVWGPCALLAILGGTWAYDGVWAVVFFCMQAGFAIFMLESVNYVEHYGLVRRERAPGRYERVKPCHSWNSSHALSGFVMLYITRHSDHHAEAWRPYWKLRHIEDAPQLPLGYSAMVLVAACPPLFFRLVHPRLDRLEAARAPLPVAAKAHEPASQPLPWAHKASA